MVRELKDIEVDGRRALVLRSGRAIWFDETAELWGEFIAGLRPWSLFGTMTYDQRRREEWLAATRRKLGYRDGLSEVVTRDTTVKDFERFIRQVETKVGHRVDYVDGVELQKNGWPHHHALIDVGEVHDGDIATLGQLWSRQHGYDTLEIPESVLDVARYTAKYVAKDFDRGDVLFSRGLGQAPVYQARGRELMRRSWR